MRDWLSELVTGQSGRVMKEMSSKEVFWHQGETWCQRNSQQFIRMTQAKTPSG